MLTGRFALVTGAAGGIGSETAKTFAKEGATVALVDIQQNMDSFVHELNKLESKNNPKNHSYYCCDISKSNQVKALFDSLKQQYPQLKVPNIIFNNAGVLISKNLIDLKEEDYDTVMNVNVKGTFLVTQEAVKRLLEHYPKGTLGPLQTYASIINVSSISGKNGCQEETHYSASKAALEGFTRSCAKELGQYKIRSNAILPGLIRTPMLMREARKAHVSRLELMTTLGRLGEPSEVAQVCLFLASDMSSYLNGASIDVNGGLAF